MPKHSGAPALDHAAVGNGRVLALVSPTSAIDWLCLPRMDSPSVFARLLDARNGGTFRFLGTEGELRGDLDYIRRTNVARTRFADSSGEWEVIDFAPRLSMSEDEVYTPAELVRFVVPLSGNPTLVIDFAPRP